MPEILYLCLKIPFMLHLIFSKNLPTLQVVLAPATGETGYELVDVAEEEPWKSIRWSFLQDSLIRVILISRFIKIFLEA